MQITAFKKGTKNQVPIIRKKAFANSMNLYFTEVKQRWEFVIHAGAKSNMQAETIVSYMGFSKFGKTILWLSQHGMPTHFSLVNLG